MESSPRSVRAWSWSCFSAVVDVLLVVELRRVVIDTCTRIIIRDVRSKQTHAAAAAAASSASDFVFPLAAAAAPSFRFFLFANAICHARFTPPVAAPAPAPRARALGVDPVAKLTMPALTPSGSGSNRNPPCCHCGLHDDRALRPRAREPRVYLVGRDDVVESAQHDHVALAQRPRVPTIRAGILSASSAVARWRRPSRTTTRGRGSRRSWARPGPPRAQNKCSSISVHVARWSSWPYRR